MSLERVVVVGTSGAGKTTLACRLGAALGHPVVELDALFWGPAWTPKPTAEFVALTDRATSGSRWIVDGNYSGVRHVVWPRATTIVWLDLPFARVLWQALCRTIRRSFTRQVLFAGNRESFRRSFLSRESILWWVITTHRSRRRAFAALRGAGAYAGLEWVVLRSRRDVSRFFAALQARPAPLI